MLMHCEGSDARSRRGGPEDLKRCQIEEGTPPSRGVRACQRAGMKRTFMRVRA